MAIARSCYDWSAKCGCYLIGLSRRWVESTYLWIVSTSWRKKCFTIRKCTGRDSQMHAAIYKCTGRDSQINARQSCGCDINIYLWICFLFANLILIICEFNSYLWNFKIYLWISLDLFVNMFNIFKSLYIYLWIIIYLFGIKQQFYLHI